MNKKLSRRKALGAIGGAVFLAGCNTSFRFEENNSDGNESQEPKSPSGVEYRGTHESHHGQYSITITDRVDNAQMCGVDITALMEAEYRDSASGDVEVTLYLYSGNDLVEIVDRYIGDVQGQEQELVEFNENSTAICEKNIDSFKLAVHDFE